LIIVKVCPAMVNESERALPEKFSLTSKLTAALPLPLEAEVMVIQVPLHIAVHAQPFATVRLTVPLPPLAGNI